MVFGAIAAHLLAKGASSKQLNSRTAPPLHRAVIGVGGCVAPSWTVLARHAEKSKNSAVIFVMRPATETEIVREPLIQTPALLSVARRLIWWMPPAEALEYPTRFLAQVMALGTWDDIQRVRTEVGLERFRTVLEGPPAGVFDQRSWHYWHHVFGIWQVPALPRREFA